MMQENKMTTVLAQREEVADKVRCRMIDNRAQNISSNRKEIEKSES